jgi:hypothetical protein
MVRTARVVLTVVAAGAAALVWPATADAQAGTQPPVGLPAIELTVGVPFKQVAASPGSSPKWTGPGLVVSIDANVNRHLAASASVETQLHHGTSVLGGAQFSTDFYYGNNRDPVPGRFFVRALAGATGVGSASSHPAAQMSVGADILVSRTRGVGVRWEVGYELVAGAVSRHANGRIAFGVILGPRLRS